MSQVHERKVHCDNCGYSWVSKSDMIMITCPSCMRKVNTEKKRK